MNRQKRNENAKLYIITGGNNSGKTKALIRLSEIYPNSHIEDEDTTLRLDQYNIIQKAKKIVKLLSTGEKRIILVTKNMLYIRALEVYCDIYNCMDKLSVFNMDDAKIKGNFDTVPDLTYSEYGVSDLYEKMQRGFYILDELLEQKYNAEED